MIISRTPFRISLFGGGTDYSSWFTQHGGVVVGTTIDKYCYLQCRELPPFFDYKTRLSYSKIETVKTNDEIEHKAIKATLESCGIDYGVEITHISDIPAKSGVGSSSTFVVGLVNALKGMQGKRVSKKQLMLDAIYIEQVMLKETVGCQDQTWAAYGGLNKIEFEAHTHEIKVKPLIVQHGFKDLLFNSFVLVYTGIDRISSDIAKNYAHKLEKEVEEQQRALMQIAEEGAVAIEDGDIEKIGKLLHENWMQKKSVSKHISNYQIDDMYQAARSAGAYGGKIIGAGGGGMMLLVVPWDAKKPVYDALEGLLHIDVGPDTEGSTIIYYDGQN